VVWQVEQAAYHHVLESLVATVLMVSLVLVLMA
jgi:hypothetical protein